MINDISKITLTIHTKQHPYWRQIVIHHLTDAYNLFRKPFKSALPELPDPDILLGSQTPRKDLSIMTEILTTLNAMPVPGMIYVAPNYFKAAGTSERFMEIYWSTDHPQAVLVFDYSSLPATPFISDDVYYWAAQFAPAVEWASPRYSQRV